MVKYKGMWSIEAVMIFGGLWHVEMTKMAEKRQLDGVKVLISFRNVIKMLIQVRLILWHSVLEEAWICAEEGG